jgi:hypothetical protein
VLKQKMGIPTYFHRGPAGQEDWTRAATAKPDLGITVLNPASGPGYTSSFLPGGDEHDLCRRRIEDMHRAGAKVTGYVTTNYRDRGGTSVQGEHRFTVEPVTALVTTRNKGGAEKETGWITGFGPIHVGSDSTLPQGLATGTDYFWIALSSHTGRFAASKIDALHNRAVEVTSPGDPGPANDNHFTGLSRSPMNISNVFFEIDEFYRRWPEIDGMFFDEMDNSDDQAIHDYYEQIYKHVKTKPGKALVIQNPGTTFPERMIDVADVFMSFESTSTAYKDYNPDWQRNYAPDKFWHAIHSCPESEMPDMIARSRGKNSGYVYVTEREAHLVNAWEHLADYFEKERDTVRAGNIPPLVVVPLVRELPAGVAADRLVAVGLVAKFLGVQTPNSWVWRQFPRAGTSVAPGREVSLRLRNGPVD